MMNRWHLLPVLLLAPLASLFAAPVVFEEAEAELVAEAPQLQSGTDNWVALRLRPAAGWHVYWRNPGDSGIPTTLDWDLPESVTAGPIHWPYPHRESLGELTNYGYSHETLHLVPLRVKAGETGQLELRAKAKWLVCKDICIPQEADLALSLPVSSAPAEADAAWREAFARARGELPRAAPGWSTHYAISGGDLSLAVRGAHFAQEADIQFFPVANDLVAHASPQRLAIDAADGLRLSQALSPYFVEPPSPVEGVLVVTQDGETVAWQVRAEPGEVAPVPVTTATGSKAEVVAAPHGVGALPAAAPASLPLMLVFALLGGLILNLMPCVFPVLAIKALSVLKSGAADGSARRVHALAYTAGVVATFVAVAALLIALRAGGEALGWGFQLQSPGFVLALAALLFAMGLSLSGAAQFGLRFMGAGQALAARPGVAGSFFTGALAVVVATPCTAPFMAPALGFALVQSTAVALLVFVALGIGLALPFLLLGFIPAFARWLPKPGAWMETFKQFMAFPLYLTVVWLLWVLGGLTDRHGMALGMVVLVGVALAVWLFGRARSGVGQGVAMAVLLAMLALAFHPALRSGAAPGAVAAAGWEPYSDARFDSLRAQGRSVFVDFTADWCLTCKLNERGVLRSEAVRSLFHRNDVALLVGDWTRADPAITAVLDRYGRSGVPLYLASRDGAEPVVLPQVLTTDTLVSAFE